LGKVPPDTPHFFTPYVKPAENAKEKNMAHAGNRRADKGQ